MFARLRRSLAPDNIILNYATSTNIVGVCFARERANRMYLYKRRWPFFPPPPLSFSPVFLSKNLPDPFERLRREIDVGKTKKQKKKKTHGKLSLLQKQTEQNIRYLMINVRE